MASSEARESWKRPSRRADGATEARASGRSRSARDKAARQKARVRHEPVWRRGYSSAEGVLAVVTAWSLTRPWRSGGLAGACAARSKGRAGGVFATEGVRSWTARSARWRTPSSGGMARRCLRSRHHQDRAVLGGSALEVRVTMAALPPSPRPRRRARWLRKGGSWRFAVKRSSTRRFVGTVDSVSVFQTGSQARPRLREPRRSAQGSRGRSSGRASVPWGCQRESGGM